MFPHPFNHHANSSVDKQMRQPFYTILLGLNFCHLTLMGSGHSKLPLRTFAISQSKMHEMIFATSKLNDRKALAE